MRLLFVMHSLLSMLSISHRIVLTLEPQLLIMQQIVARLYFMISSTFADNICINLKAAATTFIVPSSPSTLTDHLPFDSKNKTLEKALIQCQISVTFCIGCVFFWSEYKSFRVIFNLICLSRGKEVQHPQCADAVLNLNFECSSASRSGEYLRTIIDHNHRP